jgi:hypothetical protein
LSRYFAHEGLSTYTHVTDQHTTYGTKVIVATKREAHYVLDDGDVLAHISPARSENINFFGSIDVDIEGELAQLGPTGYRPLRVRDTLF